MAFNTQQWMMPLFLIAVLTSCDLGNKEKTDEVETKAAKSANIVPDEGQKPQIPSHSPSIEAVMVDVPVEDETKFDNVSEQPTQIETLPPTQNADLTSSNTLADTSKTDQFPPENDPGPNAQYVKNMLSGSFKNDENMILDNKHSLEALPKPPTGDKKAARKANDDGLVFFNNQQYEQAASIFEKANQLDPADIEALNNYGIALMKSGNLGKAAAIFIKVLSIKPDRAAAWASLGDILAIRGSDGGEAAVASYLNTYRFSKNRGNTQKFFDQRLTQERNTNVRNAIDKASEKAKVLFFSAPPSEAEAPEETDHANQPVEKSTVTVSNLQTAETAAPDNTQIQAVIRSLGLSSCYEVNPEKASPAIPPNAILNGNRLAPVFKQAIQLVAQNAQQGGCKVRIIYPDRTPPSALDELRQVGAPQMLSVEPFPSGGSDFFIIMTKS
jgi:tetratricopeptide (TPR) repeat protein